MGKGRSINVLLLLEKERVGAVGEELADKAACLDTRESELREANLDIQKKLDDTSGYNVLHSII